MSSDFGNGPWPCSASSRGNCLRPDLAVIAKDDLVEAVRLICSNEACAESPFMHAECFESFEESVLQVRKFFLKKSIPHITFTLNTQYLRATGRAAKSWTEKQKSQNLWTKRGYDLVYKACECRCGHGHVRKDLEWRPPAEVEAANENGAGGNGGRRKRKKSKSQSSGGKGNNTITIGLPMFGAGHSNGSSSAQGSAQNSQVESLHTMSPLLQGLTFLSTFQGLVNRSDAQNVPASAANRNRTNSISSNTSGSSSSANSNCGYSPPGGAIGGGASPGSNEGFHPPRTKQLLEERCRSVWKRRELLESERVSSLPLPSPSPISSPPFPPVRCKSFSLVE